MTGDDAVEIAGVRLSHPNKILFPEQKLTKLDLARHYEKVAPRMLPLIRNRPVSLVRCPQGRARKCFYQKHDTGGFPRAMGRVAVEEANGAIKDYFCLSTIGGLMAAIQMGTLEIHIWNSRRDRIEQPDRLVFDLDPGEGPGFDEVVHAAEDLAARLLTCGLRAVPMVTGGKGIHIVVPLVRRALWPEAKRFAKAFATTLAQEQPDRFVAVMSKAERKGRIFIDWLRNERGATAIAPYSTRARPGAPVAMPVDWDELKMLGSGSSFGLEAAAQRQDGADPWQAATTWRQKLSRDVLRAFG